MGEKWSTKGGINMHRGRGIGRGCIADVGPISDFWREGRYILGSSPFWVQSERLQARERHEGGVNMRGGII